MAVPQLPEGPPHEAPSSIALYLREASEVELLSPQEEIRLAHRVRAGDAAARDQMIRANLRLVVKIAKDYEHLGLPLLDLINEGNMGLMTAVDRFDPDKGAKLSTYSSWWIRQNIRRAAAAQSRTIRLPCHVTDALAHLQRAGALLRTELGREATPEELAAELGISARRIRSLQAINVSTTSLNAPLGGENSSDLLEVVPDDRCERPGDRLDHAELLAQLNQGIGRLPAREAAILSLRFGLDGAGERTLDQVGAQLGLTRERIRQIQNIALSRLRRLLETAPALATAA